ncbi:hypothetical protein Nepgr_013115 [Nepenthes gracilis]|uniref:Rhomboid-like protein 19 n=1 Tax=Nepenthes gracilis TaxID=150966 RepID=A0AAD3SIF9_NEPGR|nr:hypothetical protein Nepgr_013115 [Nepenthes gracilis]
MEICWGHGCSLVLRSCLWYGLGNVMGLEKRRTETSLPDPIGAYIWLLVPSGLISTRILTILALVHLPDFSKTNSEDKVIGSRTREREPQIIGDHRTASAMSTPALSVGGGFFTGFTRLCKGLAVVLISGHIVVQLFPPAVTYLALIPARTIPFAWNLITAGYVEQTVYGVIISTIGLLLIGKLIEPIWGSKEFLKFIFVVNFLTSVCVFITMIALYYATTLEAYLYMPISGFDGVLAAFLVGIKQILPDQELSFFSILRIKAKWLPSLMLLTAIVASFFIPDSASHLPTLIFGTYMSWIYLRYLQRRPETNLKGDPSDEFKFSSFFPEFLRPVIDPIASIFHRMLCGRSETSNEAKGHVLGGTPLPGSDPIEASRRRERGARALEERLAAERLATAKKAEESETEALEKV